MSLFPLWRRCCLAVAWLALAHSASLAQDEIVVECGDLPFAAGYTSAYDRLTVRPTWTIYVGCLTSSSGKAVDPDPGNALVIPAEVNGLRKIVNATGVGGSQQFGVALGITLTNEWQEFDVTRAVSCALVTTSPYTVLDVQNFTLRFRGRARTESGAPNRQTLTPGIISSLKEGGPAAGKTRVPNGELEPEPLPEDRANVVTDFPPYYVGDDGRVYPVDPPNYTIGDKTGNWGSGTRWRDVTSPPGTPGASPGWITDSLPGSTTFVDSSGSTWHVGSLGKDFTGWTGTVNRGPDGSTHIEVNGEGYGQTYGFTFPPGYKPEAIDGVPEATAPDLSSVDPCFAAALADQGLTGGEPPPDPDPDPEDPPDLPDGVIGDPPPLNPAPLPGGGGGGGGGGTTTPGPSVPLPTPQPPGGGGGFTGPLPPGYTPGAPLPGDDASTVWASETAREMAGKVAGVQTAAGGFMGWATVSPGTFGSLGEWQVPITILGTTYNMEIPTDHAPLVRGLLLLLVKATFVVAIFRLLIS